MKVGFRSVISQRIGYGKDGIGLSRAIMARGHDIRFAPTHVDVPIPKDMALLLTKPYDWPMDVSIWHIGPDSVNEFKEHNIKAGRFNVYWAMTGWQDISNADWVEGFRDGMQHFDAVVMYDPLSLESVRPYVDEDKLHMVMGGYEADAWGIPEGPVKRPSKYTFGMIGVLGPRKNPMSSILGFMKCKERYGDDFDAQLILRSNCPVVPTGTTFPEGIYIERGYWTPKEVKQFYWSIDTLLCPSAAEGKNLPAIEALASGTNVILSDLPSHRSWCDPSLATFVETQQVEIVAGHYGGMVHPDAMADVMWDAYSNEAKYRLRSFQASQRLPAQLDWSKCLERLSLTLTLGL